MKQPSGEDKFEKLPQKEYQKLKIAKKFLEKMIQVLKKKWIKKIQSGNTITNKEAIQFHLNNRFKKVWYIKKKNGMELIRTYFQEKYRSLSISWKFCKIIRNSNIRFVLKFLTKIIVFIQ